MENQPTGSSEQIEKKIDNPFLLRASEFVDDRDLKKLVACMGSGYQSGQWRQDIQVFDFNKLERMRIGDTLPPQNNTQTEWNDTKKFLSELGFEEPEKHVFHSNYQYSSFISYALDQLYDNLKLLQSLREGLSTASDDEEKGLMQEDIDSILNNIKVLSKRLKDEEIELPFDLEVIKSQIQSTRNNAEEVLKLSEE